MLSSETLFNKAMDEIISIFGKEYLRNNFKNTCQAAGMVSPGRYLFFVGIKDENDLPGRPADEKGWVVYANILIDAISGRVIEKEYALE